MNPTTRSLESSADGYLLKDLAAITELLNPYRVWQEEELFDELNESQADEGPMSAPQEPRGDLDQAHRSGTYIS